MLSLVNFAGSAWIPTLLLAGLTLVLRMQNRSWFAPSSFFGLYWVCALATSLIAMDHPVPGLGIWVLVALIAAVQLGCAMAETNLPPQPLEFELPFREQLRGRLRKACCLLLGGAIFGCIFFVWSSLEMFGQTLSLASLIQMAAKWTVLKYNEFSDPWSLRFAALWIYPVALLGGILRSLSTRRLDKWIGALSLLPSLLYTLLTGGRAAFLLALAFWLAGNWASRVASGENLPRLLTTKTITTFGALAAGLLLMFVVVNSFRGTQESSDPTDVMLEFNSGQIRNYMFGSPAAFSEWFQHRESEPLSWGALSFQGAYDVLRIRPKTLGTYVDSEPTVGLESTNIYTIFRGLIQDFSLLGSFALCVLAGFFSGRAYASRLLGPNRALALSAFYAVTLYSALMNPFAFNSSLLAWVVAWYVLRAKSQYSAPTLFAAD